jgi:hypothetical protein
MVARQHPVEASEVGRSRWIGSSHPTEEQRMAARIELTLDCANPTRLASFWKLALGYEDEPRRRR